MSVRFLLLPLVFVSAAASAEMREMSSDEMQAISGRDGIGFEWDLRINSDENGNPLALGPAEDRLAINFAERNDLGGEWLVLKGFSGRIYFPNFTLDAIVSSSTGTPGLADPARFVDGTGATVSPYSRPHLYLTFPEAIEIYNFTIAGASIEYGATGYLADPTDSRSFLGLKLGNSVANQPGTITAEGGYTLYGF